MMSEAQIRGLLLEEAVLYLLRTAGYVPVFGRGTDPTLEQNGHSLFVVGRGERHQIDAIADYIVQPPFSNPQRLLVEAKFYDGRQVGLTVVRNALGVLVDVSQHFVAPAGTQLRTARYHYQYAVVSATRFTRQSQRFAYAQDIFLIPLGSSRFFEPLLRSIQESAATFFTHPDNRENNQFAGDLRLSIRERLWPNPPAERSELQLRADDGAALDGYINSCRELRFALIAVTASGFPVFLVPSPEAELYAVENVIDVQIYRTENTWLLARDRDHPLFSFDLPQELVRLYSERGQLSAAKALDLKWDELRELRATVVQGDTARVIRFRLDTSWFEAVRRRL